MYENEIRKSIVSTSVQRPAVWRSASVPYDVVVLDRDVPGVHGDDVCRALNAERPATKVLMLTAAASMEEVVDGLRLGADDYMVKPFRFAELLARVHALARRAGIARPAVLVRGDLRPTRPATWSCEPGGRSTCRRRSSGCCSS